MTKSDTDPNFPPVPSDTVPPVAKGEDLSGFQGPVPVTSKVKGNETQGQEAVEYYGKHAPPARAQHDTIPNQRVVVEKTPVPPPSGSLPKVDPPGVTTDPGGREAAAPSAWARWRGPLIAIAVLFLIVMGAVLQKALSRPKPDLASPSATVSAPQVPVTATVPSATTTATTVHTASSAPIGPTSTAMVPTSTVTARASAPASAVATSPATSMTTTTTTATVRSSAPMPSVSGFVPEN